MITVANRTETAARVHYALTHGKVRIEELTDAERILHIDSKVLEEAEARDEELEIALGNGGENGEEAEEASSQRRSSQRRTLENCSAGRWILSVKSGNPANRFKR